MAVSWNNEYDCNELAQKIEQSRTIDANGRIAFSGFEHIEYLALLYSMLKFSEQIPEAEKRHMIWQALLNAGEKGVIASKSILSEINKLESGYLTQKLNQYVLVTTLSVSSKVKLRRIQIGDTTIVFNPKLAKEFLENRKKAEEFSKPSLPAKIPDNYMVVKINVQARSVYEATEKALNSLDVIRGIWNWFYNRQQGIRMSFGGRKPVNKIVLGPLHTLHHLNGKLATDTWWYETNRFGNHLTHDISSDVDKIYKFCGNVRKSLANCKYKNNIKDSIIMYSRALDEWNWDTAFLKLWGVLEELTGTEESYKVTIRRASFVFQDRNYYQQVLRHLRDYRNKYVHESADSSEIETYLFQLKNFIEVLLNFHLGNKYSFETLQDAADFLDLPSDKATLLTRLKMIKYAQKYLRHI